MSTSDSSQRDIGNSREHVEQLRYVISVLMHNLSMQCVNLRTKDKVDQWSKASIVKGCVVAFLLSMVFMYTDHIVLLGCLMGQSLLFIGLMADRMERERVASIENLENRVREYNDQRTELDRLLCIMDAGINGATPKHVASVYQAILDGNVQVARLNLMVMTECAKQ